MTWVTIPGYEKRYEFDGEQVRSIERKIKREWIGSLSYKTVGGVILKPVLMKRKGKCYKLTDKDGRQRVLSLDQIRELVDG